MEESCASLVFSAFRDDYQKWSYLLKSNCSGGGDDSDDDVLYRFSAEDLAAFKRLDIGAGLLDPKRVRASTLIDEALKIVARSKKQKRKEGRARKLEYPVSQLPPVSKKEMQNQRGKKQQQQRRASPQPPPLPVESAELVWPEIYKTLVKLMGKAMSG